MKRAKYTDRERETAAQICSAVACWWMHQFSTWASATMTIPSTKRARFLASKARESREAHHAGLMTVGDLDECCATAWATAESMIRCGWTP